MANTKKVMAIIYKQTEVQGCENPTYLLVPTQGVVGEYDEENDTLKIDNEIYNSIENDSALLAEEEYYFNDIADVNEEYSDIANLRMARELLREKEGLVVIKSIGETTKTGKLDVDDYVDGILDIEEIENGLKEEVAEAMGILKSGEVNENAKSYVVSVYSSLQSLIGGNVYNGATLADFSKETIDFLEMIADEFDNLMEEAGIDPDDFDEYGNYDKEKLKFNIVAGTKPNDYDPNKKRFPDYSIEDLYTGITEEVVSQDEHVMQIVTYLYKRMTALTLPLEERPEFGLMIIGNTGVGKTAILKAFSRIVDLPILKMNAPSMTAAGYKGNDIEDYLRVLYKEQKGDMNKIRMAFTILDEVDKIKYDPSEGKDVGGGSVQDVLLKFIEGQEFDVPVTDYNHVTIDSSDMSFICMGAYTDVFGQTKRSIGFTESTPEREKNEIKKILIKKGGMKPEFMGRQKELVRLNELNVDSMLKIMAKPKKNPLVMMQKLYAQWGVEAIFSEDYRKAIAEAALATGLGARELQSLIENSTNGPVYEINKNKGKYHKVIFTEKTVEDPKQYILR